MMRLSKDVSIDGWANFTLSVGAPKDVVLNCTAGTISVSAPVVKVGSLPAAPEFIKEGKTAICAEMKSFQVVV